MSKDDRTTSIGLFNYAHSYCSAALVLQDANFRTSTHPDAPTTFLYYHATELYLKSYLRLNGISVADLANSKKYGHNLHKLAAKAEQFGLLLDEEDQDTISLIMDDGNLYSSRYIETGFFRRPRPESLERICRALHSSISKAIIEAGIAKRLPQLE